MVKTLREAIILSLLKDEAKSSGEIATVLGLERSNIAKSLAGMKKLGLVDGRGTYSLTEKGKTHFESALERINGHG